MAASNEITVSSGVDQSNNPSNSNFNPASAAKDITVSNGADQSNNPSISNFNPTSAARDITVLDDYTTTTSNNNSRTSVIHAEIILNDGTHVPFVYDEETDFAVLYNKYCFGQQSEKCIMLTGVTVRNMLQCAFSYPKLAQNYAQSKTDFDNLRNNINTYILDGGLKQRNPVDLAAPPSSGLVELQPISSETELNELEQKLLRPDYCALWTNYLCEFYGKSGTHERQGISCAYNLIDKVFTRKFLTFCTWSGASRSNERKICFKNYVNIIKMFQKVVKLTDSTVTVDELETFFKTILQNSYRRAAEGGPSRPRRRPHARKRRKLGDKKGAAVDVNYLNDEKANSDDAPSENENNDLE